MISIVIVTCNRLHLLTQCIEQVVKRTSDKTRQIIIWNNAATDGTREYLDSLSDPRLEVIHSQTNIGTNAYRPAFERATEDYFIELDDDVIDAPRDWDATLVDAYRKVPEVGYLAAEVVNDGKSRAAEIRYHQRVNEYSPRTVNGVNLMDGPSGGWCTMTSRAVDELVGGHATDPRFSFFSQDRIYTAAIARAGYQLAILADLEVLHASGPAYSDDPEVEQAKSRYYDWRDKKRARKTAVKRALDAVPPIRALNRRFGWYNLGQSNTRKS